MSGRAEADEIGYLAIKTEISWHFPGFAGRENSGYVTPSIKDNVYIDGLPEE
jgi:hypothetical protein